MKKKKRSFDAVVTGNVNIIDNIFIVSGNANGTFKTILNINSNLNWDMFSSSNVALIEENSDGRLKELI